MLAFDESGDSRNPHPLPSPEIQLIRSSAHIELPPAAVSAVAAGGRPRAPSNPFLDTPPALSHSVPSTLSSPSNTQVALPATSSSYASSSNAFGTATPGTPENELESDELYMLPRQPQSAELGLGVTFDSPGVDGMGLDDEEDEDMRRVWVAPDLPNHQYAGLLAVFPAFVTGRQLPRFVPKVGKGRSKSRKHDADLDLEAGAEELVGTERETLRHGTGMIWVGDRLRSPGWKSSWWHRLLSWWHRMFC